MSKTQPKARTGMGTMPVPLSRQGGGFFSGMFINRAKDPTEEDVYAQATTEDLKKYISERAIEYRPPNLSAYKVEDYWKSLHEQAKVTSVVSGKGGVGKSSIALGLTEFYSQNENVLLVDFDLHNRGLTSKYGRIPPNVSTVFSEMTRFRELILAELPRDEAGKISLSALKSEIFYKLRSKFAYREYPQETGIQPLVMENLYAQDVRDDDDPEGKWGKCRPSNCYFMPSRRGGDSFLGSEESRFDVAEIAIFVTYLAHLVHKYAIQRIVLDCHGAHDLFMVGAILASSRVIIVTKPEPAAFEGTIELIKFAESVVSSKEIFPSTKVLVFNEYREENASIAEALYSGVYGDSGRAVPFSEVPKIQFSETLIKTYMRYRQPCLLKTAGLGDAIRTMAKSVPAKSSDAFATISQSTSSNTSAPPLTRL